MESKAVGIKDVARAAGVSTTTVSHALSGKGRLPEETRTRVRLIADELGYRPNSVARSLAEGRTGVVGAAFSIDLTSGAEFAEMAWYGVLLNSAAEQARRLGYTLVFLPHAGGSDMWGRLPVDGSIIVEPVEDDPHLAVLQEQHLPWVSVGRPPGGDGWYVDNDNEALVRGAFDHLRAGGARRTALVTPRWPSAWHDESIDAYLSWCVARGEAPMVVDVEPERRDEMIGDLLDRPDRPDGVFCLFEGLALVLMDAAADRKLRIPQDMLLIGGGDVGVGVRANPPLTTVDYNATALGAAAVELLVDQLEGDGSHGRTRFLPTRLIARGSSTRLESEHAR
jgi:DNA-binding LacI/PurR family transcriptional regulator